MFTSYPSQALDLDVGYSALLARRYRAPTSLSPWYRSMLNQGRFYPYYAADRRYFHFDPTWYYYPRSRSVSNQVRQEANNWKRNACFLCVCAVLLNSGFGLFCGRIDLIHWMLIIPSMRTVASVGKTLPCASYPLSGDVRTPQEIEAIFYTTKLRPNDWSLETTR